MRRAIVGSILLFAVIAAGAARADCPPLKLVASVDLQPAEDKRAEFVPVKIAGQSRLMGLDTGAALTAITSIAANDLGLKVRHGDFILLNVSGDTSSLYAEGSFEVGGLKADNVAFVLLPDSNIFTEDKRFAGYLGADILKHYDVSVDFGTDKLDLLSQDHCEGKVIYWPATAVAVVPMRVLKSGHISFQVMLDGKPVNATLDTGASFSTLSLDAAESEFGIVPGSPDTPVKGDLLRKKGLHVYAHSFKTLDFQGLSIANPEIHIIPDMTSHSLPNIARTGSRIPNPDAADDKSDMLLGMNILRHLHIYIAYKEEKLYITPAGSAAIPAPAAK